MRHQVLILDIPANLYQAIKSRFEGMNANFIIARNTQHATFLCIEQQFHLIILRFCSDTPYCELLITMRHISCAPIIALFDIDDIENLRNALQAGADLCVGTKWAVELVADYILAQFRRYTEYNHHTDPQGVEDAPFRKGDISIDLIRHIVEVRGQPVNLRKREYSLLLYFMQHPNAVLTADQICENAWGMDYTQPVGKSVHELRRLIESNPSKPCYIHTVYRVGYRFTPHFSETCER